MRLFDAGIWIFIYITNIYYIFLGYFFFILFFKQNIDAGKVFEGYASNSQQINQNSEIFLYVGYAVVIERYIIFYFCFYIN